MSLGIAPMNENQRAFVDETIHNATAMVQNDTEQRKRYKKPSITEKLEDIKGQESKRAIDLNEAKKVERQLGTESQLFRQLLEFEKRLNLSFRRRQASVKEMVTRMEESNTLISKYFRVHIFNFSFEQQTQETTAVPCWSLRIQGFMTSWDKSEKEKGDKQGPEQVDTPPQQPAKTPSNKDWRFTQVFDKIAVELDKEVYPENYLFEWSPEEDPTADGIEITVPGNKECLAKIWFHPKNNSEVYKLSSSLASFLGTTHASFSTAAFGVWNYIKIQKLQSAEDKSCIQLDDVLCNFFNQVRDIAQPALNAGEQIKLSQLVATIRRHFQPNEPILVEYPVKLSENWLDNQVCFDLRCDMRHNNLNDGVSDELESVLKWKPWEENKLFKGYQEKYYDALERMLHHKRRRDFFQGFANNPVQFVNHLIISQSRDLKIISGMTGRNPDEEKLSSFYQQQWVREAVPRYLFRKVIQDAANRQRDNSSQGYESYRQEQRPEHDNHVSNWKEQRQDVNSTMIKPKIEGGNVPMSELQSLQNVGGRTYHPDMSTNMPSTYSRMELS